MERIYANRKKKARGTMLISDKIDFRTETFTRHQRHFITIRAFQKDETVTKMTCTLISRAPEYSKQKLENGNRPFNSNSDSNIGLMERIDKIHKELLR